MSQVKRITAVQVTDELRQRLNAGHWQPGQMLPGRRALASEFGVALGTLERAVAVLLADGLLQADNGRGTFVAQRPASARAMPGPRPPAAPVSTLRGAVGIIAELAAYETPELRAGQWPAQILAGCEHGLAGEPGLVQRFYNLRLDGARLPLEQAVRQLLADRVSALVIVAESDVAAALPLAAAAGCPVVGVNYDPLDAALPQVYLDNLTSGALAVRHLRERGYQLLTFLRPLESVWAAARLAGAQAAAGSAGLQVFPATALAPLTRSTHQRRCGREAGRALLAAGFVRGTGVVAPNDWTALGFMDAASEHGLVAGRDYGLVGFDDYSREQHLTSLRPPLEQLGREAAALVLRCLRGEEPSGRIALPHRLMARGSTQGMTTESFSATAE